MMKIILILLDGLGDRSYEILDHRTPLQAAATPNLDRLASMGSNGLFHAALQGQCLPSETAHYLLLGYNMEEFPGRGLLEAVGEGVAFEDRDVLALAHLSSVNRKNRALVLTQGPEVFHKDIKEIEDLFDAITPYEAHGIHFRLHKKNDRNDAILVMKGEVSPHISDSDPILIGRDIACIVPISNNPEPQEATYTSRALNAYLSYCHKVLDSHEVNRRRRARNLPPANFLATQRCGRRILQEPFDRRWGLTGMLVASGPVYAGLAHELGLTLARKQDGQDPGEDLRERIRLALSDPSHDFIHVHTKVPDEAAHKGGPEDKKDAITALDRGLDKLVQEVERRDDLLVAVTADHSTPSISCLIHSGEPVPVALVGPNVRRDDVVSFDEVSAARGCLGFLRGSELMLMMLNYADLSCLLGHQLGGRKSLCLPKSYKPFKLTD